MALGELDAHAPKIYPSMGNNNLFLRKLDFSEVNEHTAHGDLAENVFRYTPAWEAICIDVQQKIMVFGSQ